MTIWQPGMRCVCIDDAHWYRGPNAVTPNPPAKGGVYTVAEHIIHRDLSALELAEIGPSPFGALFWEARFFRPLSETRLDQFRQHLAPTPRRAVREEA